MLSRGHGPSLRHSRDARPAERPRALGLKALSIDTIARIGAMNDASIPSVGGC